MKRMLVLVTFFFLNLIGANPLLADEGPPQDSELGGTLLISGNGPEYHLINSLAKAFEERHHLVSVDVFWHENAKPIRMLELEETHIGVTGQSASHLRSTVVARDGIAIITNFSNPVEEMSVPLLADVFSGKTRFWSQVYEEAPEMKITLINRADNQNIRQGFLETLGIKRIARSAKIIAQERHAINAVTGDLAAIAFVSITPALRAKEDGVAINLVFVDKIEPEYQTVLDKTYPLQRSVVFNTATHPTPLTVAFEQFTLSPEGQRIVRTNKFYPLATE